MEGEHSDLAPFVNFAVNCIETNSTVTFAENYFGSAVVRTTGSFDSRLSDNFRSGRDRGRRSIREDCGYITDAEHEEMTAECEGIGRMLGAMIKYAGNVSIGNAGLRSEMVAGGNVERDFVEVLDLAADGEILGQEDVRAGKQAEVLIFVEVEADAG